MRIVSYNILDGGGDRADAIANVVAAQRADVVGLVEAEDRDVVSHIAGKLAMDFVLAAGHKHASALLTSGTIRESINLALLHPSAEYSKSLLEALVADASGKEWVIGVVHLHAGAAEADEARREKELDVVLRAFAPHRQAGRAHVLCGDFNSNSPTQQIDPAKCKPKTRQEWEQNGGQIPRRVVQRLLDESYVDSFHAVKGEGAETIGSFSTEFPGQRVDYVFTWGIDRSTLREGWVEQGGSARQASDHFPVGLELTE